VRVCERCTDTTLRETVQQCHPEGSGSDAKDLASKFRAIPIREKALAFEARSFGVPQDDSALSAATTLHL